MQGAEVIQFVRFAKLGRRHRPPPIVLIKFITYVYSVVCRGTLTIDPSATSINWRTRTYAVEHVSVDILGAP